MKIRALVLLLIFFSTHQVYSSNREKTVLDSIQFELNQLTGIHEKDSGPLNLLKRIIERNSFDTSGINSIAAKFERYKNVLDRDLRYQLRYVLATRLNDLGFKYESIDAHRKLITELHEYSTPYQMYTLIQSLWDLRYPYRNSDRINEGIAYYLQLIDSFDPLEESEIISVCYHVLRSYYYTLGLLDKAIYCEQKAMQFQTSTKIVRSDFILSSFPSSTGIVGTINRKAILGSLYIENLEPDKGLLYLNDALILHEIYKDSIYLVDGPFIYLEIIRAKLQLAEKVNPPDFLFAETLVQSNPIYLANFYQLKGDYFLLNEKLDSAEHYFLKTLQIRDGSEMGINTFAGLLIPGFNIAKVKLKQKKYTESINFLLTEIEKLKVYNLRKEILKELYLLATVYKESGDYKSSLLALEDYHQLRAEVSRDEAQNRSMTFEVEQNIAKQKRELDELDIENKFNRKTKFYLMGIAVLVLLIAAGLFVGYRSKRKANFSLARKNIVILKEKERSESLLLNILPSEVAEELKAKGHAEAQLIDDVTVLFTDFKGFTQLSEQLTPHALVSEIHDCFSAFDHIMAKYGVEKIKTIGDAYMAAGGLPTANSTHAMDVVRASLEIQDYMNSHKVRKKERGELFFEIRIGVHTGPVVAGIVGVRKFQYDIWGDTVNTASRMESSGETGRINISGSTYEQIKSQFNCTYRGKISAKNKGEIDMYFVEGQTGNTTENGSQE